jgi:hypothetical protein
MLHMIVGSATAVMVLCLHSLNIRICYFVPFFYNIQKDVLSQMYNSLIYP